MKPTNIIIIAMRLNIGAFLFSESSCQSRKIRRIQKLSVDKDGDDYVFKLKLKGIKKNEGPIQVKC